MVFLLGIYLIPTYIGEPMRELERVMDRGERVIWEGKPALAPYMVRRMVLLLLFAPFLGFFLIPTFFVVFEFDFSPSLFLIPFLFFISFLILSVVLSLVSHSVTYYGLTNKRIVIQKGIIGRDFTMIEFRKLTHVEVNVSAVEKLFAPDTGSLKLHTAGTGSQTSQPPILESVKRPYELFKIVNRRVRPRRK